MRSTRVWLGLVTVAMVSGCDLVGPSGCKSTLVAALGVRVRDAQTGTAIGSGTQVIARKGALADTVVFTNDTSEAYIVGSGGGDYTLTFTKQGYNTAQQSANVATTGGRCSENIPTHVIASLQRAVSAAAR